MKLILPFLWLGLLAYAAPLAAQCEPNITVFNGLTANLTPTDTDSDGTTDNTQCTVQAADFVRLAPNPCGTAPLEYRIRKAATGTGIPSATSVTFDCIDSGVQLVEIWAGDASQTGGGYWNFTETYVIVQDNGNVCNASPVSASCGADDVPPALFVFNGLTASLVPDGAGGGKVNVTAANLRAYATDNCPGPIRLRIRKSGAGSGVPTTTSVSFDCTELGTQPVEVWAGDASGNWDYTETYVLIGDETGICGTNIAAGCSPDLTPPDALVYNGLAVCIAPTPGGIVAEMRAKPFLRQRGDNCAGLPLTIRISRTGETTTPPNTASLQFDCSELGQQLVTIWVGDGAGNWSQTVTYILVQDNFNLCGIGPRTQAIPDWKTNPAQAQTRTPAPAAGPAALSVQPNPTSGAFAVNGVLEVADFARFDLYNAFGQKVRTLSDRVWLPAGEFRFDFETGDLPAGLYRCVLQTNGAVKSINILRQY